MVAPATSKKDASRGPRRVLEGPRAGSAGSAGTGGHGKSKRPADIDGKAKKAKKKAKRTKATKGGFTEVNRGDIRSQGIMVPTGLKNSCVPDGLWPLLHALRPELKLQLAEVRDAIMPADGTGPSLDTAISYAASFGVNLDFRSEINSPRLLFDQQVGYFLVQLHIRAADADTADSHFLACLAADSLVIDNYPRRKVQKILASDRSRKNAPKVFNRLFPGAQQITLGAVLELRYTPVWSMATPPTLEDMVLELYHDRVISKEECAEFFN